MQHDLHSRYDVALERLARALELEVAELAGLLGGIDTAAQVAKGLRGFFGNPEIDEALDEVIRVSLEYRENKGNS